MVSYRDVQHLSKKTTRKTVRRERKARGARKGRGTRKTRRTRKSYHKGSRSRTHPGRKDFTTKRGNKYFDRGGHRYRYAQGSMFARLPYTVKSMLGLKARKPRKSRKTRKSRKGKKAGRR